MELVATTSMTSGYSKHISLNDEAADLSIQEFVYCAYWRLVKNVIHLHEDRRKNGNPMKAQQSDRGAVSDISVCIRIAGSQTQCSGYV
jgi:hypothetical protein